MASEQTFPKNNGQVPVGKVYDNMLIILDDFVCNTCKIGPIVSADPYMATLWDYVQGDSEKEDEDQMKKILDLIAERFKCDREFLDSIKDEPIALIALYATVEGKNPKL